MMYSESGKKTSTAGKIAVSVDAQEPWSAGRLVMLLVVKDNFQDEAPIFSCY
jgi:hypothetical protein